MIKSLKTLYPLSNKILRRFNYVAPIALIKQLREQTGSPIAQCQQALQQESGDINKAIEFLKKKGLASALKRQQQVAREGIIGIQINKDQNKAIFIEVNCETDFVARTDLFQNFSKSLLNSLIQNYSIEGNNETQLCEQEIENYLKDNQSTIDLFKQYESSNLLETLQLVCSNLQENIKVKRIEIFQAQDNEFFGSYVHNTYSENIGNSGCLIKIKSEKNGNENKKVYDFANNLALQILGTNPKYFFSEQVPQKEIDEQINKIKDEMKDQIKGKPQNVIEKILEGKMKRFYEDNVLLKMEYVLSDEGNIINIEEYIKQNEQIINGKLEILDHKIWKLSQN